MLRDLAIFGSQAAIERIFSKAGRVVSKERCAQKPATVEALLRCALNADMIHI